MGAHKLHALLGEEPVPGGPLTVSATPGPLALHCCRLADEVALVDAVVAGESVTAVLATADAHGHVLAAGGAELAATVTSADGRARMICIVSQACHDLAKPCLTLHVCMTQEHLEPVDTWLCQCEAPTLVCTFRPAPQMLCHTQLWLGRTATAIPRPC